MTKGIKAINPLEFFIEIYYDIIFINRIINKWILFIQRET